MRHNIIQQARMGALILGTAVAVTACGGGGENAETASTTTTDSGMVAGATPGGAGDSAGGSMGGMDMAGGAMGDAAIMGTINTSNAAEISTSELAQERAANREVKSYANDMIKEHRSMQKQGDQLAQELKVTAQPPAEADQMQKMVSGTLDTLKTLRGAQFDQRYMAFQVQSHQMTLDNLRRFETSAQNPELKGMITKAIPAVQQHLERAQRIQSGLGSGGAGAAAGAEKKG